MQPLGYGYSLVHLGAKMNRIDYSEIIASLNFLTDSQDSVYNGANPSLSGMEEQLDSINGEIIEA